MSSDPRTFPLFAVAPSDDPSLLPTPVASSMDSPAMSRDRVLFVAPISAGGGTAADITVPEPLPQVPNNSGAALHVKNFNFGQLNVNALQDNNGWVGIDAIALTGATFDPASGTGSHFGLASLGFGYAFNGTLFVPLRASSGANQGAVANQVGAQLVAAVGTFGIQDQPAAATQATISRAAGGAGVRHIAVAVTVGIAAVAAQPPLIFNLRDGASGAGAILWSVRLTAPAGQGQVVALSGLSYIGTANTALTLESAAAPAATNFAFVSLGGYSVT